MAWSNGAPPDRTNLRHAVSVDDDVLTELAGLLAVRNDLDRAIGELIGRPMTAGHLGEFIASRVFGIALQASASAKAIDGRFLTGPLTGRSVNVKWYLIREGMLDLTPSDELNHYLVLAGPASAAASSRGHVRPVPPAAWVTTASGRGRRRRFRSSASGATRGMSGPLRHFSSTGRPVRRSVLVVTERTREQDLLPVRLAVDDVLVLRAHRPELQQREPHVPPEVVRALGR